MKKSLPDQVHNPPRQARFHFLCPDMRIQNNSFNHVLNTIKVFENITKPSKHLSAFIKSTIDLKDCSTLLLLPVFEMSRHEKSTLFHLSTEKNNHTLDIFPIFANALHPFVSSRYSNFDMVIVHIRGKKLALYNTISSY